MTETHVPANSLDAVAVAIQQSSNQCFGCSASNPQGLHLTFSLDSADPNRITSTSSVNLTRLHEGPPGYIHGGIIATLLDEAMGKLNLPLGVVAMTRHMEVDYLRPSPLYTSLTLVGTHIRRDGRKLYHRAELMHPDGTVLARAKGLFLVIHLPLSRTTVSRSPSGKGSTTAESPR